MTTAEDPLASARSAMAQGRTHDALRMLFKVAKPAVRQQDDELLRRAAELASELADASTGGVQKEARQYATYWLACIAEPRDQQPNTWSFLSWFRRTPREERQPCPQCAESIVVGATTCRFCGFERDDQSAI